MPALILFKRRWKIASDDLTLPALFMFVTHLMCTSLFIYLLVFLLPPSDSGWPIALREFVTGVLIVFYICLVVEVIIAVVSLRGGPLKANFRSSVSTLLYFRLALLAVELFWEIFGTTCLAFNHSKSDIGHVGPVFGLLTFNWVVTFLTVCRFSQAPALRENLRGTRYSCSAVPSSSFHPSSVEETIEKKELVPCESQAGAVKAGSNGNNNDSFVRKSGCHEVCCYASPFRRNSYGQLERILSFVLTDVDLVPSDTVAGIILLKRTQRSLQEMTMSEPSNEVYQFLSGTPITSTTRFLGFKSQGSIEFYSRVVRFMKYPLASYKLTKTKVFRQVHGGNDTRSKSRCFCCRSLFSKRSKTDGTSLEVRQPEPLERELVGLINLKQFEMLHCSLNPTTLEGMSFYVGLDHEHKAVVICIWNQLCLKDVFTKLGSTEATSSYTVVRHDWFVSEYFAVIAEKIYARLRDDGLLLQALSHDQPSGTEFYELIVTGQSLAGGVACVLSVLLKQFYHNLHCFAYAPPNSIFGATCARETQSFITTIVVGKDMVPRLGCNQIESFRQGLVSCLRSCSSPKLRILCSQRPSICCPGRPLLPENQFAEYLGRSGELTNKSSGLFLPGKVIHIVRSHPKTSCPSRMSQCRRHSVFQAVWARTEDFRDVLISRKMFADHNPSLIMDALEKVLTHVSPAKPLRKSTNSRPQNSAKGQKRVTASTNSSHNETTMTSQNTVSDFSANEFVESNYAPASLSRAAPLDYTKPPVPDFLSRSAVVGNPLEGVMNGSDVMLARGSQTYPKVKLRNARPSEFDDKVVKITAQQTSLNQGPPTVYDARSVSQSGEGLYNTINYSKQYEEHFLAGLGSKTRPNAGNKRQPVIIDNWTGAFAPLASPEALSESSSLASCGESSATGFPNGFFAGFPSHRGDSIKRLSSGAAYQRLVARIDPIRQSPLGPVHPFTEGSGDGGGRKDYPNGLKSSKKSSLADSSVSSKFASLSDNFPTADRSHAHLIGGGGGGDLMKNVEEFSALVSSDPNTKESFYAEIGDPVNEPVIRADRASYRLGCQADVPPAQPPWNERQNLKSDSLYDLIFDVPLDDPSKPDYSDFSAGGHQKQSFLESEEYQKAHLSEYYAPGDLIAFSPPGSREHLGAKSPRPAGGSSSSSSVHPDYDPEPIYSKVKPRRERKADFPESKPESSEVVEDAMPPVFEVKRSFSDKDQNLGSSTGTSNASEGADSDSVEEGQGQTLYDLVSGHYSNAGRGYPHGFPEALKWENGPIRPAAQFSVAKEVQEPQSDMF